MIGYTEEDARTDDFYRCQTLKSKLKSLIEKWEEEAKELNETKQEQIPDAVGFRNEGREYRLYDCIKELKEIVNEIS